MSDPYKNCRWCHYFKDGECVHNETFRNDTSISFEVYKLFEEGFINEVIKEAFGECEPGEELVQKIEDAVGLVINRKIDHLVEHNSAEIVNPDEFYCKYFN